MATVLITGGNRGIGWALAHAYLARGDQVFLTIRTNDKTSAAHALDGDAHFLQVDVTDQASLTAAAKQLAGRKLDVLICNAGMNDGRGALDAPSNTTAMWAQLFATNVAGVFFTAHAFVDAVAAAKGKIAIISSRMGSSTAASGNNYAYRASKAAASNIAANLAAELKPRGIAVASYHPGWVQTDMGGQGAEVTPEASARGLIARIDALSLATTGAFETFDGTPISY